MKWAIVVCLLAEQMISAMPNQEDSEPMHRAVKNAQAELIVNENNQNEVKSRKKRSIGGEGNDNNVDVEVNVNVNAPNPDFKAGVRVGVNINADGDTTGGSEQYSLCSMCGTRFFDRIIGGEDASLGAWPWMAHLNVQTVFSNYTCGGSIITRDTILTAAHCIDEDSMGDILETIVSVGVVDIPAPSANTYRVAQYIRHKNYNSVTIQNDIALLKLETKLTFSRVVRPVCLGTPEMIYAGRQMDVTGWGLLDYYITETSARLQEVTVDMISLDECKSLYPSSLLDDRQICTLTLNKDACSGDSGGPMVVEDVDRYYELGLVSYGVGCAFKDSPNVASSIPYFKSWILENIGDIICE